MHTVMCRLLSRHDNCIITYALSHIILIIKKFHIYFFWKRSFSTVDPFFYSVWTQLVSLTSLLVFIPPQFKNYLFIPPPLSLHVLTPLPSNSPFTHPTSALLVFIPSFLLNYPFRPPAPFILALTLLFQEIVFDSQLRIIYMIWKRCNIY